LSNLSILRSNGRAANSLRKILITRNFNNYAEGSTLTEFGESKVICTATFEDKVPMFLKGKNMGWITAEYGMLPRSTNSRMERESVKGKQSGRTLEIQRLIGRSIRAAFDLKGFGERTLKLDCDVLQADGGTRTASITGSMVAAHDAFNNLVSLGKLRKIPMKFFVAAISVGIYGGTPLLDLDYAEDSRCDVDMNLVINENGDFIEVQGAAEKNFFDRSMLNKLLDLGEKGVSELIVYQKKILGI